MPQGLVLILPNTVHVPDLSRSLPASWQACIHSGNDQELHLQGSDASWYLTIALMEDPEGSARDYGTWDNIDDVLRSELHDKRCWSVTYNDFHTTKCLLAELFQKIGPSLEHWWIDNDFGLVLNGAQFLHNLISDDGWDWRTSNP